MIHDVDETLRALIRRDVLPGTAVDVVFDAPTKEWSSRRNTAAIDVYLYDIREDLRRREVGRVDDIVGDVVVERRQPPRWFKLSYLVTAWTQRPEDEHRLLSAVMGCLLRQDSLPRELLAGSLSDYPLPVPYTVGMPPPDDRALSDVWSAMGGELKPSLDLVVTVPFDLGRDLAAATPVREGLKLHLADPGADPNGDGSAGAGRPDGADGEDDGDPAERRRRPLAPTGSEARTAMYRSRRGPRPDGAEEVALANEERRVGDDEQAGRILRITEVPRA